MPSRFAHSFAFDPGYGYSLADLLAVDAPAMPADFAAFWQSRYERTLLVHPRPSIKHTGMAHNGFNVPTFGNHPLRLQLPAIGSGAAVQRYQQQHGNVMDTLQYYDAASAARFIR